MLYRKIQTYIEDHLKSDSNKILVIDGARQINCLLVFQKDKQIYSSLE